MYRNKAIHLYLYLMFLGMVYQISREREHHQMLIPQFHINSHQTTADGGFVIFLNSGIDQAILFIKESGKLR